MADFSLKAHDRLPSIQATLLSGGVAVDLTGCTVKFIMADKTSGIVTVTSPATVVTASSGIVRYDWAAGDTDTPSSYQAEWEVTDAGGKKQTFPTLTYHTIDILADLDDA